MILIDKNEMHRIANEENGVIIDVREPIEFIEANHPGSVNLPLSGFNIKDYGIYKTRPVILMCQTQNRSIKAGERLQIEGYTNIYILRNGMVGLLNEGETVQSSIRGWTIDRQFRMALGILLLVFLLGSYFISPYFIVIPVILCCGLIFTSVIDKCYMRMAIAQLPWNKGKKV